MTSVRNIAVRAGKSIKAMFAAALTVVMLSVSTPGAVAQDASRSSPQQGVAQVQDEVRGVLSQYGRFVQHEKYGEVWVPTVTPQGWHPYAPCNWVNTRQYGWYYDDKTPWGQIVHHYGRWVSDAKMGWIWTPGSEFSPGWVVWRTSPQWVGWAPMLPDEDVQSVAASDFNNAAYWIFVETQKFAQGCNGSMAPPAQIPVLLTQTTYVTDILLVGGITVFVLPQYVVGPLINIDIYFTPWPTWFLAQTLIDWNFMWNNLVVVNEVVYQNCAPPKTNDPNNPKPFPVNNPPRPPAPPAGPDKPVNGPPVVVVTPPPPSCPIGTVFADGACRLSDPCRGGLVRVGNACIAPVRPEPLPTRPPIIVTKNPCANLSGGEFQRCIRGTPPQPVVDTRPPPGKTPPTDTGDTRPVGNRPPPDIRQTGPVGGSLGVGNPNLRNPNVVFHPNGPQPSNVNRPRDPAPVSNRLPAVTSTPMRTNPNPVVLGPGGGGMNRTTVGSNQASNNPVAARRTLPVALPRRGDGQAVVR